MNSASFHLICTMQRNKYLYALQQSLMGNRQMPVGVVRSGLQSLGVAVCPPENDIDVKQRHFKIDLLLQTVPVYTATPGVYFEDNFLKGRRAPAMNENVTELAKFKKAGAFPIDKNEMRPIPFHVATKITVAEGCLPCGTIFQIRKERQHRCSDPFDQ